MKQSFNPMAAAGIPPAAVAAAARAHAQRAPLDPDDRDAVYRATVAELAKLGISIDGNAKDRQSLISDRNSFRKAVNALADRSLEATKAGDSREADRLDIIVGELGRIVGKIDRQIDAQELISGNGTATISDLKPLRNQADFEKRFRSGHSRDDSVGSLADFCRGIAGMRTTGAVQNALSVGTDSQGGYAVPTELMPGILAGLVPASSLLQAGAGIIIPDVGAKTYNFAGIETIPTAAWRNEAAAVAESDPAFRTVTATPRSLAFLFKISRELLADGQGIEDALRTVIVQAFAKELDRAGLRGTGTAPEIRGLLNTSGIGAVSNGANGASLASSIKYGNLLSAASTILGLDAPMPTAAIMSTRDLVGLNSLADTTGQPLRTPPMLDGVKLIGTSQVPTNLTVGTSTDCSEMYVGDFSKCAFVLREQVSIQLLRELYAATGQLAFVGHARVDLVTLYPKAFCKITGIRP